ncbi:MAG: peroxiredoxin family protein [Candidatus Aquicultor sp.]
MAQIREKLPIETIIPFFNLPSTQGKNIKTWDYKQRKHLVIYFFTGADCTECRPTLQAFANNYYEYRRLTAEVLAIATDNLDRLTGLSTELQLPFPLLADPTGEVTNKYTFTDPDKNQPLPSIFIADKFGSLEEEWIVENEKDLPGQEDILSLLQLFELRCPE